MSEYDIPRLDVKCQYLAALNQKLIATKLRSFVLLPQGLFRCTQTFTFFVYTENLSELASVVGCVSCLFRLGLKYLGNEPSFSASDSAYKSFLFSQRNVLSMLFSHY